MKKQDGKTPLMWVVTIAVSLIIGGIIIAMIFGGTDIASEIREMLQKNNSNNTIQTDNT